MTCPDCGKTLGIFLKVYENKPGEGVPVVKCSACNFEAFLEVKLPDIIDGKVQMLKNKIRNFELK